LIQGGDGWLTDEKGLYILKDGRRLPEDVIEGEKEKGASGSLLIGRKDVKDGFLAILEGVLEKDCIPIKRQYNVYKEKFLMEQNICLDQDEKTVEFEIGFLYDAYRDIEIEYLDCKIEARADSAELKINVPPQKTILVIGSRLCA
jgi:hypothetical protein